MKEPLHSALTQRSPSPMDLSFTLDPQNARFSLLIYSMAMIYQFFNLLMSNDLLCLHIFCRKMKELIPIWVLLSSHWCMDDSKSRELLVMLGLRLLKLEDIHFYWTEMTVTFKFKFKFMLYILYWVLLNSIVFFLFNMQAINKRKHFYDINGSVHDRCYSLSCSHLIVTLELNQNGWWCPWILFNLL